MARMASKIAPNDLKDCSKRPPRAQDPPRSAQEVPKGPPRALKGSRALQDPKIQTAKLEFRVHRVGSAGTAKRKQSAAHLPVCIGVLNHRKQLLCPHHGSQIPLGMLPLPSLGAPRGAALRFAVHTESQVNAGSMHVHATFSAKMASRALKMPSRWSKSRPRALQEAFKKPFWHLEHPRCNSDSVFVPFWYHKRSPGI